MIKKKNSEFLAQLKSGDVINFTPPITVPIIKHHNPADLNLTLLSNFFVKKITKIQSSFMQIDDQNDSISHT
jgi:hypothetical protein